MNIENINVVKNEIPYSKIVEYINFVIENSYSKEDGVYHEYLREYSEALAILTMYTDCDEKQYGFDNVMKFIHSPRWGQIKDELGDLYMNFRYYVQEEINYYNTPMRSVDNTMKDVATLVGKIISVIDTINLDALKNYDFTKLANAIDTINNTDQVEK